MNNQESFETVPKRIHPREIKETIFSEIVIVGAGISGLTAAVSAAEQGAKTIVLEKGPTINFRGGHNAAIASRMQEKQGIKIDREQVVYTIMEHGAYRSDQRVVKTWADNCDKVMNWLIDMAEEAKIEMNLEPVTKPWYFPNYPVAHSFFPKRQETLANMLLNKAIKLGVDFRFERPVVQLIRSGQNRIIGVIAQNPDGGYTQFNVSKAVLLCSGDYGSNRQMVDKYCWPGIGRLRKEYTPDVNTGDGHKMGMWVGAAIDDPPHCVALWDFSVWTPDKFFTMARQPWLYVNLNGERFMNEDLPYGYSCTQILRHGGLWWSVWDGKYDQEWPKMQSQCCKNMGKGGTFRWHPSQMDEAVKAGNVLTAQTIEELARKMEVSVEIFKATAARYTELARSGKDLDFGKHPDRLTTLEKPLFYACKMEVGYLVILGGLKINTKMQVLDTSGDVIPGLYAAGNVSGSFFGHQYPSTLPGLTHSRAWTFGRLAALNAVKENW